MKNIEDYYRTYSGRTLLEKHSLEEVGVWEIRGEDPNCDLGGSHHQPRLEIVEGKLRDVVEYGVTLAGFWQWGGGGSFTKINILPLSELKEKERAKLLARLHELEKEMEKINSKL